MIVRTVGELIDFLRRLKLVGFLNQDGRSGGCLGSGGSRYRFLGVSARRPVVRVLPLGSGFAVDPVVADPPPADAGLPCHGDEFEGCSAVRGRERPCQFPDTRGARHPRDSQTGGPHEAWVADASVAGGIEVGNDSKELLWKGV